MLYIRTLIIALMSAIAFWRALRHNIHMFQLDGYKNPEHITWISKNGNRQWLLGAAFALGLIRLFTSSPVADALCFLCLYLIILVFGAMRRLNTKKKLVFTARVKRLIFTQTLLSAIVVLCVYLLMGPSAISAGLMFAVSLQMVMPLAANTVNAPVEKGINQHYINDAKRILKEAAGLKIIGVTGSYGKTSVKFYLETLLQDKFNVLVTPESYNTPMGVVKTVRGMLRSSHEIFVCEMGARHVGDIKELCDIVHPHHGIITSVGPQHLETFFNMDNIKNTKFELADALPEGGLLFLNGDNEYIMEKAGEYPGAILYHGSDAQGGYRATDIKLSSLGTEFTVTAPDGESERFSMYLVGGHNVINVMGAIAVAHTLGMSLRSLKAPVRRIRPVEHRMELKAQGDTTIIDDAYNSNPVGSKAAVETLAMFKGLRILITPGMVELGDKEEEYNRKFGEYAAKCCDYIFLVGKKRAVPIRDGALSAGFDSGRIKVFDRFEEAYSNAVGMRAEGQKYILIENDLPDNY